MVRCGPAETAIPLRICLDANGTGYVFVFRLQYTMAKPERPANSSQSFTVAIFSERTELRMPPTTGPFKTAQRQSLREALRSG
jgi:hypothetical protein